MRINNSLPTLAAPTLFVLVIIVMLSAIQPSPSRSSRDRLIRGYRDRYFLALEEHASAPSGDRHILLFQSNVQAWPGANPQVILITDGEYRAIAEHTSHHESMFFDARIVHFSGVKSLEVRRIVRPGLSSETFVYSIRDDILREEAHSLSSPVRKGDPWRELPGQLRAEKGQNGDRK